MPLNRNLTVTIDGDSRGFQRASKRAQQAAREYERELDRVNARMVQFAQIGATIGPPVVAGTAAAAAAMGAAATAAGTLAAAGGTVALAMNGLGDALDALNKAHLDPTEDNLAEMGKALAQLAPAGRDFVVFLDTLRPKLQELQALAQQGLLPGVESGIRQAMVLFPELERLVDTTATAMGRLAEDAGEALSAPFWSNYIAFLNRQAAPTVESFGAVLGNLATGFAGVQMAFGDLTVDMGRGLEQLSAQFAEFGAGLRTSSGFAEFVGYVRDITPQILDTLASVASALGAVAEAAAPIAGPTLAAIRGLADAISFLASLPGATTLLAFAAGVTAVSRAVMLIDMARMTTLGQAIGRTGVASSAAAGNVRRFASSLGRVAPVLGGAALAADALHQRILDLATDLPESTRVVETALTAIASNVPASAAGLDELNVSLARYRAEIEKLQGLPTNLFPHIRGVHAAEKSISQLDAALAAMVESGRPQMAASIVRRLGVNAAFSDRYLTQYNDAVARQRLEHHTTTPVVAKASDVTNRYGIETSQVTQEMIRQSTNAARLRNQINLLTAEKQGAINKEIAYEAALDRTSGQLRFVNGQLVVNTAKQRTAAQAVLDSTKAAEDLIVTYVREGRSAQFVSRETDRTRRELVDQAVQMGLTREAAQRLIDKYFNVPADVSTAFHTPGLNSARRRSRDLHGILSKLDRNWVVNIMSDFGDITRGYAAGGPVTGPGGPTDDRVPIRASAGEHMWTAREVTAAGGHRAVEDMRRAVLDGAPRFARGGPIDADLTVDYRQLRRALQRSVNFWDNFRVFDGGPGLAFAQAQNGEPYVWGGVGPHGWDCSGIWSGVVNVLRGRDPNSRLFSTHSFAGGDGAAGFRLGFPSPVRVGVDPGSHMAGTIGGVNVESSGSHGVRVGGSARGASYGPYTFGLTGVGAPDARPRLGEEGFNADRGGVLPHGWWATNTSGHPEAVLTSDQWEMLRTAAEKLSGIADPLAAVTSQLRGTVDALTAAAEAQRRAAQVVIGVAADDGGRTPTQRAAAQMLNALRSGTTFFEDFSYRGASGLVQRLNDRLAERFYNANPSFDFGGPRSLQRVERFLRGVATPQREVHYHITTPRVSEPEIRAFERAEAARERVGRPA